MELTDEVLAELERQTKESALGGCIVTTQELIALIAAAKRCRELEAECKRLQAEKDEMVARNKLLRNRPDLPLERVAGYDAMVDEIERWRYALHRIAAINTMTHPHHTSVKIAREALGGAK